MSRVFHTSDWHLGHKNILKYRPDFNTIEEHDALILNNYKAIILKRDTVYFHGDIAFDKRNLEIVSQLQGRKVLIVGNHDTDFHDMGDLVEAFDKVYAFKKHKGAWLSHAPIHESELRGKICIHGHTHFEVVDHQDYYNVCVEQTNYAPVQRDNTGFIIKDNE